MKALTLDCLHPPVILMRTPLSTATLPTGCSTQASRNPEPKQTKGENSRTLWLRSVTPADLKSGNLMPAVSGTAWGRSYEDQVVTGNEPTVSPSTPPSRCALRAPHSGWGRLVQDPSPNLGWFRLHTGFSASFFWGSFFLGALRSVRRCSAVVSAAVISFCRSWLRFSRSFFRASILRSSCSRYSSSAT